CILEGMGIWPAIAEEAAPIQCVHVSERNRIGLTTLKAHDYNVAALGYVVPNRSLGQALQMALQKSDVHLFCPARWTQLQNESDHVDLRLETAQGEQRVTARLLIAADGARSKLREQLAIQTREWDYNQHAIIVNVQPEQPHEGIAYERFTAEGPMALLPLSDNRYAVVLTVPAVEVDAILALSDDEFLTFLQQRFGMHKRFTRPGKRAHYPLKFIRARQQSQGRVLLMGNAAHNLHPIAGQGFNLSLRDTARLVDSLADNLITSGIDDDDGVEQVVQHYLQSHRRDQLITSGFTDSLHRIFGNPLLPIRALRGIGLMGLSLFPFAKNTLARHTMGLAGKLPRLARGVPVKRNTP
ncbi:MAG TPA: FAD-dependent monooxygenase, partial [Gammaproteobacteria bacterium]|nr:FAD-dependent monooxygenase [Gammaproteobacteria bacterium]